MTRAGITYWYLWNCKSIRLCSSERVQLHPKEHGYASWTPSVCTVGRWRQLFVLLALRLGYDPLDYRVAVSNVRQDRVGVLRHGSVINPILPPEGRSHRYNYGCGGNLLVFRAIRSLMVLLQGLEDPLICLEVLKYNYGFYILRVQAVYHHKFTVMRGPLEQQNTYWNIIRLAVECCGGM